MTRRRGQKPRYWADVLHDDSGLRFVVETDDPRHPSGIIADAPTFAVAVQIAEDLTAGRALMEKGENE